jgi:hypothetical protein
MQNKRIKELCDSYTDYESNLKEHYHKLYSAMVEKDKGIARRYDDLRGSQYLLILLTLLREGVLNKEDIKDLDEELKNRLMSIL